MVGSDFGYEPSNTRALKEPADPLQPPKPEELDILEALDLIDSDFKMDVPDSPPPAVSLDDYQNEPTPPATIEEAEEQLNQAQARIDAYQKQLDSFTEETRALVPMDRSQANDVKNRAAMIARTRRDIGKSMQGIKEARAQIAKAASARAEDPTFWQEALGVGAKALGIVGTVLENSPLAGISETFLGLLSPAFEGVAGDKYRSALVDNEYVPFEWSQLAQAPLSIFGVGSADWGIRKRGRQVGQAVGRALTAGELMVLDTPVLREIYKYSPMTAPAYWGPVALSAATGWDESTIREFRNQLAFEVVTDPLNLLDFGGHHITKLGRLRSIARVNAGAWENAAFFKALEDVPELAAKLPDLKPTDAIINDLRAAGVGADEAANLAQAFDFARAQNLKDMRTLATDDPTAWALLTREYLEGHKTPQINKQLEALDEIDKFGDATDPILGRTFREQAVLGQRLKVWDNFFERFGDSKITRGAEKVWSRLTGQSILADIADNPEAVELYFAQRAFKADAGGEVLRYQQDVTHRVAKILNELSPEDQATVLNRLPGTVERTTPEGRKALREGIDPIDQPLKAALSDMADLYDESAATLRAIENRFGIKVAEFLGDFRYFGRELSDELRQWLLENPKAQAIMFGDTTRRSKDAMSAALLPEEKGRKLRELDFETSEAYMRNLFPGLPANIPIWGRNAFGTLVQRADRALNTANLRNLYDNFVSAHAGMTDPKVAEAVGAEIAGMIDGHKIRLAEASAKAEGAAGEALAMQAGFREARPAVRAAGGVATRQADEAIAAGARAAEVRGAAAESREGSQVAYQRGRDAESKAVSVAEQLKAEAVELVQKTPGASAAREGLKQARKILASATKHEQLVDAAAHIAREMGADLPKGAGHDAVKAAEELVRYTEDVIKANPAIKDADKALRVANLLLAEARETAARIEVFDLQKQVGDLLKQADDSVGMKGIGAKYLTQAFRGEARKAKALVDEVAKAYVARQNAAKAALAQDFVAAKKFRAEVRALEHKSVRDVRAALSGMRAELRKDAPAALVKVFDRVEKQALRLEELTTKAQAAVAKPVALAVNQKVRDAEKVAKEAVERELKGNPDNWTPEAKAEWLLNKIPAPPGRETNALRVLLQAKVTPPDDWRSLARLAATNIGTDSANEFQKLAQGLFWQRFEKPGSLGKAMDALKGIYQRSTLARIASLTKDLWGTTVNGLMSGNTAYLDKAMKEVGSFLHWQKENSFVGDNARRLKAQGVLRTTKGEALDKPSELEALLPGKLGKFAGRIEREGLVGGTLQSIGAPTTGKAASKALGGVNDARVYWEEVNRVATYLKATNEGMSHAEAVVEVYKFWGKFDELSRIERKYLNRILFFWSWQARSIPVTIRHLFEHPVRSKLLLSAMAGNVDDDEQMPDWMRRMGGVALGRDENGRVRVANIAGSTYFSPTFSMLQGQFVNQAMQGKPMEAASGALRDLARSMPPYMQSAGEIAFKYDFFQDKPWWRDRNAQTGSNAKAPSSLWWFYDDGSNSGLQGKITDLLGLEAKLNPDGTPKYLSMNPYWSWFFGALPGVEAGMADASAFFTSPKKEGGMPELDPAKGIMRQGGMPVYDVPVETAASQIYDFKRAVMQDASGLSGGSLYAEGGQVTPNKNNWRGSEIRSYLERAEGQARLQGMGADAARAHAREKLHERFPQEARLLALWDRLEAWESYLIQVEKGPDLTPQQQRAVELVARRADYNRLDKYEKRKLDELIARAGR